MTIIQDIHAFTAGGRIFHLSIGTSDKGGFIYDGILAKSDVLEEAGHAFPPTPAGATPDDAFNALVKGVMSFCAMTGDSLDRIDSPTNCEFISADRQRELLRSIGVNARVTVNGLE